MQLNQEQTKRINDFLEGIGVEYIDIRYEMVDHIASEIEEKVNDTEAFFENQRFQTIFVKYMLSKKDALQKKYQKIVKRRFWTDIKTICKNMSVESLKVKNIAFLTLLIALSYSLSLFDVKNTLISLYVLSFVMYGYTGFTFYKSIKKYGNIKLIQSYTMLLTFISYFPLYLINNPLSFSKSTHSNWKLTVHVALIYFIYSLYKTFINQKEKIDTKYKYLAE